MSASTTAPLSIPATRSWSEAREATITRASALERFWTRMTGDIEFMELCEFSFSEEIRL